MGSLRAKEIQHSEVVHLENEMNNLWGELNTSNVPHAFRMEMEKTLSACEEEFKSILNGQAPSQNLEKKLQQLDRELANAVVEQGKSEIPKGERAEKSHMALKNIERELEEGGMSPSKARHEVKEIARHRTD